MVDAVFQDMTMMIIYTQAPDGTDYRLIGRARTIAGVERILARERRGDQKADTYCHGIRIVDERTGAPIDLGAMREAQR